MNEMHARLNVFWEQFLDRLDPGCARAVGAAYDDLAREQEGHSRLGPGDEAPDFTLPDSDGAPVRLGAMLTRGPAVLVFFRGSWSPFCRLALRAYSEAAPAFAARGAGVIGISAQRREGLARLAFEDGLAFPLLCDAGAGIAGRFGIACATPPALLPLYRRFGHPPAEQNQSGCNRLALPATYLVGRDGRIRFAHVGVRPHERAAPEEVLAALTPAHAGTR